MYLYFFEIGNLIKVGISNDPKKRLKDILKNCPLPVSFAISCKTECARDFESALKFLNRDRKIKGEWFIPYDGLMEGVIYNPDNKVISIKDKTQPYDVLGCRLDFDIMVNESRFGKQVVVFPIKNKEQEMVLLRLWRMSDRLLSNEDKKCDRFFTSDNWGEPFSPDRIIPAIKRMMEIISIKK